MNCCRQHFDPHRRCLTKLLVLFLLVRQAEEGARSFSVSPQIYLFPLDSYLGGTVWQAAIVNVVKSRNISEKRT